MCSNLTIIPLVNNYKYTSPPQGEEIIWYIQYLRAYNLNNTENFEKACFWWSVRQVSFIIAFFFLWFNMRRRVWSTYSGQFGFGLCVAVNSFNSNAWLAFRGWTWACYNCARLPRPTILMVTWESSIPLEVFSSCTDTSPKLISTSEELVEWIITG